MKLDPEPPQSKIKHNHIVKTSTEMIRDTIPIKGKPVTLDSSTIKEQPSQKNETHHHSNHVNESMTNDDKQDKREDVPTRCNNDDDQIQRFVN